MSNQLEIEILTKYLGADAASAAAADLDNLREVTGGVDKASQAAGDSAKDLGKAEDQSAISAEHSAVSHRALHLLLHQIGDISAPGAGRALAAL